MKIYFKYYDNDNKHKNYQLKKIEEKEFNNSLKDFLKYIESLETWETTVRIDVEGDYCCEVEILEDYWLETED